MTKTTAERPKIYRMIFQGRKFFINPSFQKKFMGFVLSSVIISMGVMYGANWVFFNKFITYGEKLNLPDNHPFYRLLLEQQDFMTTVFFISSFILCLSLGIAGLFFSHRIAGPLFRLNKVFSDAHKNDVQLKEIHFRHDDFFQEVPVAINKYLKSQHSEKEEHKKVS
jgi:hypothetical protein